MANDQPDLANRHPRSDELLLLIEVADSSATFDLGEKRDLYARAGVVEYWVLDLNRRVLVIHREPHDGFYAHVDILSESGVAAIADLTIPVSEMLT
ncbi:MAG: Uma2 family endonuclease [Acidobacteria bacterium]|nr:Uma2 family endonuclease [Acidobacteriota bacterium]